MSGVLATTEIPVGQGVSLIRENGQAETFRVVATPGGGATLVASYYNASSADLSAIPQLNGIFYTVPVGGAGLYRYAATFGTPGAFVPGVDSAQISAFLNGTSQDAIELNDPTKLYQGGEGTQAALFFNRPIEVLLHDGDTIQLSSFSGGTVSVLVRLELVALVADL